MSGGTQKTQDCLNIFRDNYCRNGKLNILSDIINKINFYIRIVCTI